MSVQTLFEDSKGTIWVARKFVEPGSIPKSRIRIPIYAVPSASSELIQHESNPS
jgi:hypothetical protein